MHCTGKKLQVLIDAILFYKHKFCGWEWLQTCTKFIIPDCIYKYVYVHVQVCCNSMRDKYTP